MNCTCFITTVKCLFASAWEYLRQEASFVLSPLFSTFPNVCSLWQTLFLPPFWFIARSYAIFSVRYSRHFIASEQAHVLCACLLPPLGDRLHDCPPSIVHCSKIPHILLAIWCLLAAKSVFFLKTLLTCVVFLVLFDERCLPRSWAVSSEVTSDIIKHTSEAFSNSNELPEKFVLFKFILQWCVVVDSSADLFLYRTIKINVSHSNSVIKQLKVCFALGLEGNSYFHSVSPLVPMEEECFAFCKRQCSIECKLSKDIFTRLGVHRGWIQSGLSGRGKEPLPSWRWSVLIRWGDKSPADQKLRDFCRRSGDANAASSVLIFLTSWEALIRFQGSAGNTTRHTLWCTTVVNSRQKKKSILNQCGGKLQETEREKRKTTDVDKKTKEEH